MTLASIDWFDGRQLRMLQALGITTVDDFVSVAATDAEPLGRLLGGVDVHRLEADLLPVSPMAMMAAADVEKIDYYFGAALPGDVEVPEVPPDDYLFASLGRLQAGPEDAPSDPDQSTSVNHGGCMRPVRDQAQRRTCVAHACAAVLECVEYRRTGTAVDLSPQFLYWNCKRNDGRPQVSGTLISVAMNCLMHDGVCLEADWPYVPMPVSGNEGQAPPPANAGAAASAHKALMTVPLTRRSSTGCGPRSTPGPRSPSRYQCMPAA